MNGFPEQLEACTGFEWDVGDVDKNRESHGVSNADCEQVFYQRPFLIAPDLEQSQDEPRYAALGRTADGRRLTIMFTIRGTLIRVISARPMSRCERRVSKRKNKPRVREPVPEFRSEDEEREFWAEHDVVDYFDWESSVPGSFPALKPSTRTISLRLPKALLEDLKALANERDVPCQSLLKVYLAERVARERGRLRRRTEADG